MLRDVAATIGLISRAARAVAVPALAVVLTGASWGILSSGRAGAETTPSTRYSTDLPSSESINASGTRSVVTSHRSATSSSPAGTSLASAPPGVASPESPAAYAAATLRPHLDGATGAEISSNWAGQLATGAAFTSIGGQWTVPAVQLSASVDYSLTAIGVDGTTDSLIQAGTEQNSDGGSTSYGAWYEVYPGAPVPTGGVVEPGDTILASITESTSGSWTVALEDSRDGTKNWGVSVTVSYDGPATSAEWIEEAPSIEGTPSTLANFGSTAFTDLALDGSAISAGRSTRSTWQRAAAPSLPIRVPSTHRRTPFRSPTGLLRPRWTRSARRRGRPAGIPR